MTDGAAVETALSEAVRDREEKARLENRLREAEGRLAGLEIEVADRATILGEESRDVEKLESFSPTRIWAGLTGRRDVDLDRETAERDAARYALAEAEARRDLARRDCDALSEQSRLLGDTEARFAAALEAKEAWVGSSPGPVAEQLAELARRRGALLAQDRELAEAHAVGVAAHQQLLEADRVLGSAESWSTWDTFGGGGMLTDMMKYDRIDKATAEIRRADHAVKAFARELADVALGPVRGVEITPMTEVFDVFFDNIFSDWGVRARIQEASERTRWSLRAVEDALAAITTRATRLQDELQQLDEERERLLTG